jgi:hypothetical protein
VTNRDARKFIAVLLITQEGNEGSPISPLETHTDIQLPSIKRPQLGKCDQFLHVTNCWKVYACLIRTWIKFVSRVNIFLWFPPIISAHLKLVFLLLNKQKAYLLPYVHIPFQAFMCNFTYLGQPFNWGKFLSTRYVTTNWNPLYYVKGKLCGVKK